MKTPEVSNATFIAYNTLLRRERSYPSNVNRYASVYNLLPRVHAVMAVKLLEVVNIDAKGIYVAV